MSTVYRSCTINYAIIIWLSSVTRHVSASAFKQHKVVTSLLVSDLAAVHLLDEQISFAHVVLPHIHLAIGNPDVDALHSAHQVIHQALAIPAYNVDEGIGWRCAVVDCHLQLTRQITSRSNTLRC